ncbi:hypothetical protein [Streptomyces rimosus]|uniref:hypothetical protein n=1 Tax=Streptomyces rimosus TaxID=1927 RepID=UPI001F308578|nr:hypothetical protein [Streptomyces rimosus]
MGKHARPTGKRAAVTSGSGGAVRARPLPIRSTVLLRRPVDIWHKPALSAVVALGIPEFTLLALGRLDLVLYTSAGAMCALYAHGLPYAARARTLVWVVLGMVASLGVALSAASLTTSVPLLVLLASLVAAVHKMVCDATRVGPPGNLIFTFISASAFFVPQRIGQLPFHLALALGAGGLAWLVCMAPALVRPRGPERIATARALEAAAGLLRSGPAAADTPGGPDRARHATAAAVNAAWQTLFQVPGRTPAAAAARAGLERLLVRAESALAARDADPAEAERYFPAPGGGGGGGPPLSTNGRQALCPPPPPPAARAASPPCSAASRPVRRCCPSARGSPRAVRWRAGPRWRSVSAIRTGPWSPRPPSTRPTPPSRGSGPSSAPSATCSACCSSPRCCR